MDHAACSQGTSRRRATALGAALAAVLLVAGVSPAPAGASSDSNIPGVPLPGSVVTGQLGGPIYDHVYSVTVPSGYVILLSLTGDPGTDFDLYLFDESATTIYTTHGQVAVSNGPTSTESISYGSIGGGTYYIDLNGATNVEGSFRLVTQVVPDRIPPRVSLRLGNGSGYTNSTDVPVTVVATDDLSGVLSMSFSANGVNWQAPEPYAPTTQWSFPPGDGPKSLWVRVVDRAGNPSLPASATIVLDTVPPTVTASKPGPGLVGTGPRPTFRITFSKPIQPASWSQLGLLVQDPGGLFVSGTYSYDAASRTGVFVPAADLTLGASYVVSVGEVQDLAGNAITPTGPWVMVPAMATRVQLDSRRLVATVGARVVLLAAAVVPVGDPVLLERRDPGAADWVILSALSVDSLGRVSAPVVATANAWYRLAYAGSPVAAPATSLDLRLLVRRSVALQGVMASGRPVPWAAGRAMTLTARVGPVDPAVVVTFTISRYDASRHTWVTTNTVTRTTAEGTAAVTWRPGRGTYYVRLTTPPTPLFANGISAAYLWIVH